MTIEEYILGYTAFASFVTSLSNIVNTREEGVMSKIFRDSTENHEAKQDLLFLSSQANCKIAFFFCFRSHPLQLDVVTAKMVLVAKYCSVDLETNNIFPALIFNTGTTQKMVADDNQLLLQFLEEKKEDNLILESSTLPSLQKRQSLLLLLRF